MSRYKIIPLRQMNEQIRKQKLDTYTSNSIHNIFSKSYTSDTIIPPSIYHIMRPWNMHTMSSLYTHTTFGCKFIDTYHVSKKEFNRFLLTPEKIFKNGNIIADESSTLVISPGLLFRFVVGNKGASTINVQVNPEEYYDESITPFPENDILRTCTINKDTNTIELLDEPTTLSPDTKQKLDKMIRKWDNMQFII